MIPHLKYDSSEIALLEGNENYTHIFLENGERLLSSYTLLRHEERLPTFIRISRKYLVNPEYILRYEVDSVTPHVVMKCGRELKVPRRRVKGMMNETIIH